MMRFHHFQANAADVVKSPDAFKRFDALEAELATIGATVKLPILMVHDEACIEIDCPEGREAEAATILNKHFPR
jgi:hypothetical protein